MKKIFTLIMVAAAFAMNVKAQDTELEVPYAANGVVADGYVDDVDDSWTGDWIDLSLSNDNNSTSDMSAQFQIMHDADFIYTVIDVQDATPNNDAATWSNSYERDCSEQFFMMDTAVTEGAGAYAAGSWQVRVQREAADDASYIDGNSGANTWSVANLTGSEDFAWGVENGSSEWVAEIAYPKTVLADASAFDGVYFRFDIAAADNTGGGRTQQQYWHNNTDNQWQDTRLFGIAQLMESTVGVSNLENAGKAFVRNGMLKVQNVDGLVNVYDLRGAVVRSAVVNGNASINISDLKAGMYVVKGANLSAKIVK